MKQYCDSWRPHLHEERVRYVHNTQIAKSQTPKLQSIHGTACFFTFEYRSHQSRTWTQVAAILWFRLNYNVCISDLNRLHMDSVPFCSFGKVPHENLQAIDRISVLACVCTDHKLRASPHIKARTPASKGNASNHNAATMQPHKSVLPYLNCTVWQLQLQFTYMGNSHHGFQSQYIAHCNHLRDYIMWHSTIPMLTHMSDCSVQCTIKIRNSETTIANAQCLSKH